MLSPDDKFEFLDENGEYGRREAYRRLKGLRDGQSLTDLEELIFLRQIQAVFPTHLPPAEPKDQPPSGRMTALRMKTPSSID